MPDLERLLIAACQLQHSILLKSTEDQHMVHIVMPQALGELKQTMEASGFPMLDETTLQWFLRDRKFDADAAAEKLRTMQQWRSDFKLRRRLSSSDPFF